MSLGGLEGARYERTTPQTVWEPGRPIQLGRSTSSVRAVYRARVLLAPPQAPAAPSTPQIEAETISAQALQAATETISTQAQAAAAALAAMANGGARGQGATALV